MVKPRPIYSDLDDTAVTHFYQTVCPEDLAPEDCWPYSGTVKIGRGRLVSAAKVGLTITLGHDIEPGSRVVHSCDTRNCVNPAHLSVKVKHKAKKPDVTEVSYDDATIDRLCTAARMTLGINRNVYRAKYGRDGVKASEILTANQIDVAELLSRP